MKVSETVKGLNIGLDFCFVFSVETLMNSFVECV